MDDKHRIRVATVALALGAAGLAFVWSGSIPAGPDAAKPEPFSVEKAEGFVFTAALTKGDVLVCDRVSLTLALRNVSGQTKRIVETSLFQDYRFVVKDAKGKVVPLTQFGEAALRASKERWRTIVHELKEGETFVEVAIVNRAHDMTMGGVYTIVAMRRVPREDRMGYATLATKAVTVRVTDVRIPAKTRKPKQDE